MHIVVAIKQVPDTTNVRINPETGTLIREGVPAIINPYDVHAIELAVQLKEKYGGKVTVVTMGPPKAAEALSECVEQGADRCVLITDRKFAAADTLATSYVVWRAIDVIQQEEPVDLFIFGMQAIDGDTAQVGPGIARRLNLGQLTYIQKVESVNVSENIIIVHRRVDLGYEVIQAKMPCVITVEKEINELQYSPLPEMLRAAKYQPQIWGVNEIHADVNNLGLTGSPTTVRKIFSPPERIGGQRLEGSIDEVTQALVGHLLEKI
ncbi:MAG: electron transfer flavoprotein subunit beta/FixA family protein [Bacteroidota bacterium]